MDSPVSVDMFGSSHNRQIFRTIISLIVIYVMDNFARLEVSAERFFHYKTMFVNIATISKRMIFGLSNNISTESTVFTANPSGMFFTFLKTADFELRSTLVRAKKILGPFKKTALSIDFSLTNGARNNFPFFHTV